MGKTDVPDQPGTDTISYLHYSDLSRRLGVRSTNGGILVRGQDHLLLVETEDAVEPAMDPGEIEIARLAGVVEVIGPVKNEMGLVMRAASTTIITSKRLIVMGTGGHSLHGAIVQGNEIHTIFWPWDLVDTIGMPAKTRLADRIAGNRTIDLFSSAVMTSIRILPHRVQRDGAAEKIGSPEAFGLLTDAVAEHRVSVSPKEYHTELEAIIRGDVPVENGELLAQFTPDDAGDIPPHLAGRLLDVDGNVL